MNSHKRGVSRPRILTCRIVGRIPVLSQQGMGSKRISDALMGSGVNISRSSVHRLLVEHGLGVKLQSHRASIGLQKSHKSI
jgi:hypothetical protein